MTILRDPAAIRYQNVRSIAIPGMQARRYAVSGYQDYSRGMRGAGVGGITETAQDYLNAARGRVTLGVGADSIRNLALFGTGVGVVVGIGIGFALGRFLGRKRR